MVLRSIKPNHGILRQSSSRSAKGAIHQTNELGRRDVVGKQRRPSLGQTREPDQHHRPRPWRLRGKAHGEGTELSRIPTEPVRQSTKWYAGGVVDLALRFEREADAWKPHDEIGS